MPPVHVMIKPVSGACNMQCRYCFYCDEMAHRKTSVLPPMTVQTLENVVRRTLSYADDAVTFAFQGGEPTLAGLPFYEALVHFVKMYNTRYLPVQYALQTNGYELSDEMIAFFVRHHFLLGVSLDGIQETHDALRPDHLNRPTYARVCSAIERLKKAGAEYNVLCVVNEQVAVHAGEVYEALKIHTFIQFIPCLEGMDGSIQAHSLAAGSYLSFLKTTFDLYERDFWNGQPVSIRQFDNWLQMMLGMPPESCSMRGTCSLQTIVESDGSVYPCDFYVLDEWKMGNLNEQPLRRIARSETGEKFIEPSLNVPDKCRACCWYALCRNGCRREREPESGLSRWCGVTQAFFEYAYERMKKIAEAISAGTR